MLITLARLESPQLLGRFVLGYTISLPVILLFNMHLRSVQAGDARREFLFGDYLGLRLATVPAGFGVIVAIAVLGGYPRDTFRVIAAVGLVKVIDSIGDVFHGLFQREERMDRIAISMIARGLLSLLAFFAAIRSTRDLELGVLAMAVALALVLVAYDLPAGRQILGDLRSLAPRWRARALSKLIRLSLPLGIAVLLMAVVLQLPQFLVERLLGESALGIFAAMFYVVFGANMLVTAVGESVYPRLARLFACRQLAGFHAVVLGTAGFAGVIGVALVVLAVVAGEPFLRIFYGAEYSVHADTFVVLCIGGALGFLATVLNYAVMATRRFALFVAPYLFLSALAVLSQVSLIGRHALIGSAWAVLFVNTMAVLVLAVILRGLLGVNREMAAPSGVSGRSEK